MSRITVVIDGAAEGVHLGMLLAGGRVTSASVGDLIEEGERLSAQVASIQKERDVALASVEWAARCFLVPSDFDDYGDDKAYEKTVKDGAEALLVGGKRLYDEALKEVQ